MKDAINNLDLSNLSELDDIITDSLWILDKRDASGSHSGWYWGNFVPQIPRQMMLRYTKIGDWVLDPFAGSGTTLIECKRLGRNGIGIELNGEVVIRAQEYIKQETSEYNSVCTLVVGDSQTIDIGKILLNYGTPCVDLIILHPPYHDIIKFSESKCDLSNASTLEEYLSMFRNVINNVTQYLRTERYLVLVIGDKYTKGEWIPLGFYCMNEVLKKEYVLKSIVVKNFNETRGKRQKENLWRYRALVGGFYIFKHEYIMIFKKTSSKKKGQCVNDK